MATSTSSSTSDTVTLDKTYFETLLRRAQFHTPTVEFPSPVQLETITIPKTDHDSLLSSAHQYENLRRNLYRGGIAEETLAILIQDDNAAQENGNGIENMTGDETSDGDVFQTHRSMTTQTAGAKDFSYGQDPVYTYTLRNGHYDALQQRNGNAKNEFRRHSHEDDFTCMPEEADNGFYDDLSGQNDFQAFKRPAFEKFCQRTVQLCKLSKATTHADIVDAVRGGMLLDIYLRSQDSSASVSFLQASDAEEFFRHVKRHDLYIRGKRIEIRWNDRQFILPGHVANKVYIGATRNLVIRNYAPRHTEEMIRDDLEHIHNLVVIKVTFDGQNAHIATNSVHNAMFARTCMMSRVTYKGSKIDWDPDECAAPLERPQYQPRKDNLPKKKGPSVVNRFLLLDMGEEDGGSLDDDHDTNGTTFKTTLSSTVDALVA